MSRTRRVTKKSPQAKHAKTVVCFGEVLWDCLPKGIFLGGAPLNVAYHLAKQGLRVLPVTAVGRDFLGDELLRRVGGWGLELEAVTRDARRPTGTVLATLDSSGSASYDITRNVAWDHIELTAWLRRLSPKPDAIVYGTLALRGTANRRVLDRLLALWPDAIRVVDLNFRAPFDTERVSTFALVRAQLVKMNQDELARLTGLSGRSSRQMAEATRRFAEKENIPRVCVTAGDRGAGLLWDGEWFWENAQPVAVRDTVGAGDAFLGALLAALLGGTASPSAALSYACRVGEFVASQDGATPSYNLAQLDRLIGRSF